ncbi:peptidoglycan endopeptidase [Sesbania bispinosa]|nr:peptidoglycan endopeptidase [Sesbania bispinosa]
MGYTKTVKEHTYLQPERSNRSMSSINGEIAPFQGITKTCVVYTFFQIEQGTTTLTGYTAEKRDREPSAR